MKAIILAGGYATRLHPLTKNLSKCLIDVKGKPIIEHIVGKIEAVREVDEIFVVTNEKFSLGFEQWLKEFRSTKRIKIINDHTSCNEERKGAIGDIAYAVESERIEDELMVIAGDNLFEFSLAELAGFFRQKGCSVVALHRFESKEDVAGKFGVAMVDSKHHIINFEEKPEKPKTTLAATACYIFTRQDIGEMLKYAKERKNLDNPGDFISFLAKKKNVYGFVFREKWFDIGSFESLGKAREKFSC